MSAGRVALCREKCLSRRCGGLAPVAFDISTEGSNEDCHRKSDRDHAVQCTKVSGWRFVENRYYVQ